MFKTPSFLSLALITLGCSSTEARRESSAAESNVPEPTAAPSALQTAHDAYLAGDFLGTGEAIRDVLLDPSSGSLAKENALELLDSAYEATNGKLPTRFVLPPGFRDMQLGATHGTSKFATWRGIYLWMRVNEGMGPKIDELTLLDGTGKTIFTKDAPDTKVQIKHVVDGYEDVVINLDNMRALPPDGLYTIRIGLDGKRVVDTWVIARHLEATATPVLTAPAELSNEARPTVRFEPFHSPELASFERRSLDVWIGKSNGREEVFNFWTASPDRQSEVRIDKDLPAGSYWVSLNVQERRSFGPIEIERGATMGAPFSVVR